MEITIHLNYKFAFDNIKIVTECVIKGDEKIYEISCASILAKQYRDRIMIELHTHFPEYEWHKNKGYGTKAHIDAIKKYGCTILHRFTFLNNIL